MIKSLTALVAFLCLGPPSLPPAPPADIKPELQAVEILRLPPEILQDVVIGANMMVDQALAASDACGAAFGPAAKLDPKFKARLEVLIKKYAKRYRVDEKLVRLVLRQESGGNPQAVSPKGAQGLMQLMPDTAAALGVQDAFDPEENIAGGVKYLKHCLKQFNQDVVLALAAYNAGPKAVEKYKGVPPYQETEKYVANITQAYRGKAWNRDEPEAAEPPPVKEETGPAWKIPTPAWKIANPQVRVSAPRWREKSPGLTQARSPSKTHSKSRRKFKSLKADNVYYRIRATGAYPKLLGERHLARSGVETNPARTLLPPVRSTENIP